MPWSVHVKENCSGCEECIDVCPVNVYEMEESKSVPAHEEECIGCMSCVGSCPAESITVEDA